MIEIIHVEAKIKFLQSIDSYECCGGVWKNGTPCLGRFCPIEAERKHINEPTKNKENSQTTKNQSSAS
jgi:hypothetical protein